MEKTDTNNMSEKKKHKLKEYQKKYREANLNIIMNEIVFY